jgi:hypothetical protein
MSDPSNTTRKSTIGGGHVGIPGHEKTIAPLRKIVAEYRTASFDSSGKYNFSQQRQDEAVKKITDLVQFYSRGDAIKMLGRSVASAQRPATTSKPPRRAPKPL